MRALETQALPTRKESNDNHHQRQQRVNKLNGTVDADEIYGYEGNDNLSGDLGDDLLDGGIGSDTMAGGAGNDIFMVDSAGDVVAEYANEGMDTVGYAIEQIQFGDGTIWFGPDLNKSTRTINGTTGNDVITGHWGIDLIDGKAGDDMLQGGAGGDTYYFASGSGSDTISEAVNAGEVDTIRFFDVRPDEVSLQRKGNDLLVRLATGDEVRVAGQFAGSGIEKIEFGNGISWGAAQINSVANEIIGTSANNSLSGTTGTDLFYGLGGDDTLYGRDGSDTYFYARGDGRDLITKSTNTSETDTLRILSNVTPNDIEAFHQGWDLVVRTLSDGGEVRVRYQYSGSGVEKIEFDNGVAWDINQINNLPMEFLAQEGGPTMICTAGNDRFYASYGDDVMKGTLGSDTYFFKAGDDRRDMIYEVLSATDVDRISFDVNIRPENVHLDRSGSNLLIHTAYGGEIVVVGQYVGTGIEEIVFADGQVWGAAKIGY